MSENIQRTSAKIIPFPVQRRSAAASEQASIRRIEERPAAVYVECSGAWYHDEAIKDGSTVRHS